MKTNSNLDNTSLPPTRSVLLQELRLEASRRLVGRNALNDDTKHSEAGLALSIRDCTKNHDNSSRAKSQNPPLLDIHNVDFIGIS
jgi:hypothetical protein